MLGVVTRIAWPELTDTPAGAGLRILYELGLGDGLNTVCESSAGNKSGLPRISFLVMDLILTLAGKVTNNLST